MRTTTNPIVPEEDISYQSYPRSLLLPGETLLRGQDSFIVAIVEWGRNSVLLTLVAVLAVGELVLSARMSIRACEAEIIISALMSRGGR